MKTLQILLLEDNEDDALLLARELRAGGCLAEVERVYTESGFCEALARDGWDAVIADFNVPGYGARAALRTVRERGIDLPFIVVSGVVGEENAVGAMKAGAHDFILKEQLSRLVPAIGRELGEVANRRARRQAEQALRESEERLRVVAENVPVVLFGGDAAGDVTYCSPAWERFTGRPVSEAMGVGWINFVHPDERRDVLKTAEAGTSRRITVGGRNRFLAADGTYRWMDARATPIFDETGALRHWFGSMIDIDDEVRAELALREAHATLEGRVAERTAELRQANERLEQEIAERHRLETKIAEISEAERRNIRHELHDGLCQELAGIGFMSNVLARNLAAADRSEAKEAQAVSDLVHDTLNRTRKLARGISPVEASEEGLMGALGELASTTRRIYGIDCRFECPRPVLIQNNTAAGHLYRIAQEAIHNALENGKAGVVRIALEPFRSGARLSIEDNGIGLIEKGGDHPGIGIRVMRHRATSIGAELEIRPAEGGGTAVVCAWKKKL